MDKSKSPDIKLDLRVFKTGNLEAQKGNGGNCSCNRCSAGPLRAK